MQHRFIAAPNDQREKHDTQRCRQKLSESESAHAEGPGDNIGVDHAAALYRVASKQEADDDDRHRNDFRCAFHRRVEDGASEHIGADDESQQKDYHRRASKQDAGDPRI